MKKDNFDLRSYLIENKMTENSRGDVRHQLGKTILDTRILSEMQIPADPNQDDPNYEDDADQLDDMWDSQMDADIDEYGDLGGNIPLDEAGSSKISADSLERLIKRTFGNSGVYSLTFDTGDTLDAEWMESRDDGVLFNQKDLWSLSPEERKKLYDLIKSGTHYTDSLNGPDFLNSAKDLDEASYTDYDDDDDWQDDNLDLDDRGGASLLDLVKGDKKAGRARKAAAADTAADPAMDDDPVDTDAPEIDDPEEEPAGVSDPNAEAQPGLSAQIKYNPNTVEMEMDDQELDQYLSGFRRPQVAVNVLNRAIRTAQNEVNDSIGLKHLYIVLENGFYVTSRFPRGQVIAKVSADQEWRKKNFGESLQKKNELVLSESFKSGKLQNLLKQHGNIKRTTSLSPIFGNQIDLANITDDQIKGIEDVTDKIKQSPDYAVSRVGWYRKDPVSDNKVARNSGALVYFSDGTRFAVYVSEEGQKNVSNSADPKRKAPWNVDRFAGEKMFSDKIRDRLNQNKRFDHMSKEWEDDVRTTMSKTKMRH